MYTFHMFCVSPATVTVSMTIQVQKYTKLALRTCDEETLVQLMTPLARSAKKVVAYSPLEVSRKVSMEVRRKPYTVRNIKR